MSNLTIRNISQELLKRLKIISTKEKRSLNSEILILLEQAFNSEFGKDRQNRVSKEAQVAIWNRLAGEWKDKRKTREIIEDIYSSRTAGRKVKL